MPIMNEIESGTGSVKKYPGGVYGEEAQKVAGNSKTSTNSSGGGTKTTTSTTEYNGAVDPLIQAGYDKYKGEYTPSGSVTAAYNALQKVLNNKPGEFSSEYTAKLEGLYDQILNRPEFSYNQNDDVLYGMYKDQYTMAGKTAMQDAMGQVASNTGGFASSAAQSAGFAQYQNYLNQLNQQALNLQQQAFNRYTDEGNALLGKFNTTENMYNIDYTKYRDTVSDWQSDRSYYQGAYESERNFDYNKFASDRDYYTNEYWNQRRSSTVTTTK